MSPKLTLSRAIMTGCSLIPAVRGTTFAFEATGKDYSAGIAHQKPILGADALGTALTGLVGDAAKAVERSFEGPDRHPVAVLERIYPELTKQHLVCPDPSCDDKKDWMLVSVIWHVQDRHNWSRQQVASFLNGRGL